MGLLDYAGDGLWIIALAIMASASASARRRIRPGTLVPMLFDGQGRPSWRLPRDAALWLVPGFGFALSLLLLVAHRVTPLDAAGAVMLFGLRATLAGGFALAHIVWLKMALTALDTEGELAPWDRPKD